MKQGIGEWRESGGGDSNHEMSEEIIKIKRQCHWLQQEGEGEKEDWLGREEKIEGKLARETEYEWEITPNCINKKKFYTNPKSKMRNICFASFNCKQILSTVGLRTYGFKI